MLVFDRTLVAHEASHADPYAPPKGPTRGMRASEQGHRGVMVLWTRFSFLTSGAWRLHPWATTAPGRTTGRSSSPSNWRCICVMCWAMKVLLTGPEPCADNAAHLQQWMYEHKPRITVSFVVLIMGLTEVLESVSHLQTGNFPRWRAGTGNHPVPIHLDSQLAPFCRSSAVFSLLTNNWKYSLHLGPEGKAEEYSLELLSEETREGTNGLVLVGQRESMHRR